MRRFYVLVVFLLSEFCSFLGLLWLLSFSGLLGRFFLSFHLGFWKVFGFYLSSMGS